MRPSYPAGGSSPVVDGEFNMTRSQVSQALLLIVSLLMSGCQTQALTANELAEPFQATLDMQRSVKHIIQGEQRLALEVPGLSAAVILPDGSTWIGASGKSSDSESMDTTMLFGLASASKTYIAALVADLASEGALSMDDPIGIWIPELGQIDGNISIRQLLNHTSGLYQYQQKPEFLAAVFAEPEKVWTPQEIVEEFQGEPECQPGQCFGESSMDYVLLGMIIEKATGSSVSSLLTERFFNPLNLKQTFLYPEQTYPVEMMAHMWWDTSGTGEPVDVVEGTGELPLASLWSGMWTSGAIHSTAKDLAQFAKDLFDGKVIQEEALQEMLAPGPDLHADAQYGYSVIIEQIDGKTVYWHPGGAGYSSVYYYVPDDGISIAVLGNLMVDLRPVAIALHEAYLEYQQ